MAPQKGGDNLSKIREISGNGWKVPEKDKSGTTNGI
jgi:hypothetical protein